MRFAISLFLFSVLSYSIDLSHRFDAIKAACEGGKGAACTRMAHILTGTKESFVKDIRIDLKRALVYAIKGCELGDEDGCFFAGMTLYYGDEWGKIERDKAKGKAYIEKACELGKEDVCSYLEVM